MPDRVIMVRESEWREMREALAKCAEGWGNAVELDLLPPSHHAAATYLRDEARRALTAGKPEQAAPSGWLPIETAPKDGRLILVATDGQKVGSPAWTGMYCAYWSEQEQLWLFHRSGYVPNPTHWMPLPAAPTAGGGDD